MQFKYCKSKLCPYTWHLRKADDIGYPTQYSLKDAGWHKSGELFIVSICRLPICPVDLMLSLLEESLVLPSGKICSVCLFMKSKIDLYRESLGT